MDSSTEFIYQSSDEDASDVHMQQDISKDRDSFLKTEFISKDIEFRDNSINNSTIDYVPNKENETMTESKEEQIEKTSSQVIKIAERPSSPVIKIPERPSSPVIPSSPTVEISRNTIKLLIKKNNTNEYESENLSKNGSKDIIKPENPEKSYIFFDSSRVLNETCNSERVVFDDSSCDEIAPNQMSNSTLQKSRLSSTGSAKSEEVPTDLEIVVNKLLISINSIPSSEEKISEKCKNEHYTQVDLSLDKNKKAESIEKIDHSINAVLKVGLNLNENVKNESFESDIGDLNVKVKSEQKADLQKADLRVTNENIKFKVTPKVLSDLKLNIQSQIKLELLPRKVTKYIAEKQLNKKGKHVYNTWKLDVNTNKVIAKKIRKKTEKSDAEKSPRRNSKIDRKNSSLFKKSQLYTDDDSSNDGFGQLISASDLKLTEKKSEKIPKIEKFKTKKAKPESLLKKILHKQLDANNNLIIRKEKDIESKIITNFKLILDQSKLKSLEKIKSLNEHIQGFKIPKKTNTSPYKIPSNKISLINNNIKQNINGVNTKISLNVNNRKDNSTRVFTGPKINTNEQNLIKTIVPKDDKIIVKKKKQGVHLIIPTLEEMSQKKKNYFQALDCPYPYFSMNFLLQDYLKKMNTVPSLDITMLIDNICVYISDPLCVSILNINEKSELCRLMSRNAGHINNYHLFGIGSDLRENPYKKIEKNYKEFNKIAENFKWNKPNEFENDQEEQKFISTAIPMLTMAEAFVLYSHFKERLRTPFRTIKYIDSQIESQIAWNFQVVFENNWEVESLDYSPEECVKYVLHRQKDSNLIRNSLCRNLETSSIKQQPHKIDIKLNKIEFAKKKIRDEKDFDRMYIKKFNERLGKRKPFRIQDFFENEQKRFKCDNDDLKHYNKRKNEDSFVTKRSDNLPRFYSYKTILSTFSNTNRGAMRQANDHKIKDMCDREYSFKVKQINEDCDINLSQLFTNDD